jgi:predicted acetyltransferase
MDLELVATTAKDQPILLNLMQLYVHDFSEFLDIDLQEDGRFPPRDFSPYWAEPGRHALFIRVDARLAGFVLVDERSRLAEDRPAMDMAEFFVLRKYRRRGVGARAAVYAFELFPGPWEVRQVPDNVAATAFWRKTIDRYTGGRFTEVILDGPRWRGPVQFFDNSRPPSGER